MEALAEETAEGIPLAKSTSLPGAERYATQLKVQVPHGVSVLKGSSNSSGLCCCCPSSEVSYLYFAAARLLQHLDASAVVDAARRKRFHRARIAAAEADRAATAPWRYLLSVGSRSLLLLLTEYPAAGAPEGDAEAADQMLRQLQIFALSLHQTQHRAAANRSVLSPFPPKLQLQHPPHQQGAAASRKGPPSQGGSSRSTSQRRLLAALLLALDTLEDKRRLQLQQQQSPLHGGLQDTQGTDQQQQPPPLPPQGSVVLPRLGSKEDEKLRRLLGGPCPAAAAGVAIVATTQLLPEELDSAVVRAGRLDSWIPWA
ncbi:RNA pseudouridylate synthase [Cyclospora cayetanensis]|uniref:RNA pseudouridylate synthase n=1 Tax=Cyclospora cayetanensis TaxID=88456 RepID=A0A1D3CXN9_9EIME|nr:RNA pseudouridylate synthase [Cyclospora cayetanensis]